MGQWCCKHFYNRNRLNIRLKFKLEWKVTKYEINFEKLYNQTKRMLVVKTFEKWFYADKGEKKGWVPHNYVSILEDIKSEKSKERL